MRALAFCPDSDHDWAKSSWTQWVQGTLPHVTSRTIPPYDHGTSEAARPFGMPMCQNRLSIPTWSYAMEVRPPARVVEIGTYSGGFTCGIGVHASRIRARVVSYDVGTPDESLLDLARHLGIEFRQGDVWERETEIAALIAEPGISFVLCDGGNKRRELRDFGRYLKPGDVIAAHDYAADDGTGYENRWWGWGEIWRPQGDETARELGLVPWMQDYFDTAAWLCYERPVLPR